LKENKKDTTYKINWDSKEIWKEKIIAKKFIKHLTEKAVKKLLENKDTKIGIVSERDSIEWIKKNENENLWETKIKNHICEKITQEDNDYFVGCDYEDFKSGYFYVASLWEMMEGKNLIILEYYR